MLSRLFATAGLAGAIALLPIGTAALSAVDARSGAGIDDLMAVIERVKADYVDEVDDETLIRGAIQGMLTSLDPHSGFLDENDFAQLRTQTEGSYGGLGLSVTLEDGVVKIIAPTADTPADKAGLKSGDYITHLDGKLLYGGTLDEAVAAMRGRPGETIRLTIVRPGRDAPFDVAVTRAIIDLKPVKWEVKDRVGVITVSAFSEGVGTDVAAAIQGIDKALGGRPIGYVLDLRSNPGGLLDEAVALSDIFIDKGVIVSQRGRARGDNESYAAEPGDLARGLPVIVLVDEGSASASEIVAGALQDHRRGLVMGQTTFGKGSVQTLLPLSNSTALRLTTARYFTPSGRSVQEGGIRPDIRVPQISDPDYKKRFRVREADLRRHLINELKQDDAGLQEDEIDDPRFKATAEELKKQGIEDFQLHYALDTLGRLGPGAMRLAGEGSRAQRAATRAN
jgi:carboxyl-terminal processing protease